jgi:hypothetical protein
MSHPVTGKVADKVVVELIEADVDIGFALVDEAKAYSVSGQPQSSCRALQDAENIVAEIERRLDRLGDSGSGPFRPLLAELRNQIAAVERKPSS